MAKPARSERRYPDAVWMVLVANAIFEAEIARPKGDASAGYARKAETEGGLNACLTAGIQIRTPPLFHPRYHTGFS